VVMQAGILSGIPSGLPSVSVSSSDRVVMQDAF